MKVERVMMWSQAAMREKAALIILGKPGNTPKGREMSQNKRGKGAMYMRNCN